MTSSLGLLVLRSRSGRRSRAASASPSAAGSPQQRALRGGLASSAAGSAAAGSASAAGSSAAAAPPRRRAPRQRLLGSGRLLLAAGSSVAGSSASGSPSPAAAAAPRRPRLGTDRGAPSAGAPRPARRGALLLGGRRAAAVLVDHQAWTSIGSGFCAACGWSGPAYTFSLRSWARPSRLRGSMPLTARRMTSSGRRVEHLLERAAAQAAWVAGVAVVALLLALVAGHRDLLGVDHDHEVAHVAVRRVLGLALAAQGVRDLGREPAQRLAGRVDDEPVALARLRVSPRRSSLQRGRPGAAGRTECSERPAVMPATGGYILPRSQSLPNPHRRSAVTGRGTGEPFGGRESGLRGANRPDCPGRSALSARARQLTP